MSLDLHGGNSAQLLTANDAALTIDYTLLTFGEQGFTSAGKVTVDPGTLDVPAGQLPVNDEHVSDKPVGYMSASDAGDTLTASVSFFHTDEGRQAYEDAKTGARRGISMEVLHPVIRAGKLVAGALCGAGIVKRPAFPSSLLLAAYSEDGDTVTQESITEADVEAADEDLDAARAALDSGDLAAAQAAITAAQEKLEPEEPEETEDPEEKENTVGKLAASAASPQAQLASLLAGLGTGSGAPAADDTVSLAKFTASFREAVGKDSKLRASHLETMTQTDLYDPAVQPAFLGELWQASPYDEIWAPLVSHEGLTALTYKGYRWVEGADPIVDDWDPAFVDREDSEDGHAHMMPIPTSALRLEGKDFHAKRIAGGNRFDRALLDFPVPGVLESFLALQTEYIKRRRDARVRDAVLAQAGTGMLKNGTYNTRDLENTFRRIIVGAMHVRKYGKPTFAMVGNDIYRDMLGTDMLENLALLEKSLGLEGGSMAGFKIAPADIDDTTMNGRVLVGVDKSIVLHEPAGAPIRVDAQDLAVGAVDKAVFTYYMIRSDDRGGIVEVPGA